jgi:hypothetical protein
MSFLKDSPTTYTVEPELPAMRTWLARAIPVIVGAALLGLTGTAGTWASFTASTDNSASLATGSLVLANTVGAEPTCESDDDAGTTVNASTCDQLFAVSAQRPGDAPVSETVVLENVGSIDDADLSVHADGACQLASVGSYSGTGDLCDALALTIQEYSDSGFTTPSACLFGGGGPVTCSLDAAYTVNDFIAAHGSFASTLPVGELDAGPAHRRYVRVSVQLPDSGVQNSLQGRSASISLTWRLEQ